MPPTSRESGTSADPSARNGTEAPGGRHSTARTGEARPPEDMEVRKHSLWASATLAFALAATACGSSPSAASSSPSSSCVNVGAPHHAYVVVQHLSGATFQTCVGFSGDTIDGATVMYQSKIEVQTQTYSFGLGVCQLDNEPKSYAQCLPSKGPYWSEWVEVAGAWSMGQTDYPRVTLHDKEALGWRYEDQSNPSPAPPPVAKET